MTKHVLCLRHLGHENFWEILHNAGQMASHAYKDESLKGKKALVLSYGKYAPGWNLCTQALADLSALPMHLPIETSDITDKAKLARLLATHPADICITYGLPKATVEALSETATMPVLGACSESANLGAVLGDLTLMRSLHPAMDTMRIAWLGGATPLAHSLIEASMYVPYELFMALPEWGEPDRNLLGLALTAGSKIFLTREVHLAADEAHFVYAGAGPAQAIASKELRAGLCIDSAMLALARPEARLLLAEQEGPLCRVAENLLDSPASLAQVQAEYSLKALKVLIPWVMNSKE